MTLVLLSVRHIHTNYRAYWEQWDRRTKTVSSGYKHLKAANTHNTDDYRSLSSGEKQRGSVAPAMYYFGASSAIRDVLVSWECFCFNAIPRPELCGASESVWKCYRNDLIATVGTGFTCTARFQYEPLKKWHFILVLIRIRQVTWTIPILLWRHDTFIPINIPAVEFLHLFCAFASVLWHKPWFMVVILVCVASLVPLLTTLFSTDGHARQTPYLESSLSKNTDLGRSMLRIVNTVIVGWKQCLYYLLP